MERVVSAVCKLSHKQFRAILKKFRRKRIRQQLAKEREKLEILEQQKRENSPSYKETQEEIRRNSDLYDQFEERERIREHKLWLFREERAQEEFRRKQKQLELEKIKREEERKRILEEFEKQEYVEKQAEEEIKKKKSLKEVVTSEQFSILLKLEALQEALSNLSEADGPWHNPIAPVNYSIGQEREQCMFFSKTGCCRFGERCSRGHTRPAVSTTILIRGMYSHFSIDQTGRDDYDTDIALEYEDKECYQDFKNFYYDVLPEFKKFGKVIQFKVCNNFEPHLRGNVYVQYTSEEDAVEAYKNFNGRYYAGRQITCDFTHVIRWRSAICGLHGRNMCPKGINCNFLHVFKNPNEEFWEADRDLAPREKRHDFNQSRKREYSKEDRFSRHTSENRHRSSRHESRSERYESRSERHESRSDRYESRSDRYESRSDRHEARSDRYNSNSDRHEARNDRYESRNDRHESRSDRYESKNDRYESKSDKYESRNDRNMPRYDNNESKYESRSDRYEVKNNISDKSSECSSDSSEENKQSSKSLITKREDSNNSKHRKRLRDSSPSSRSDSPEDSSYKKDSHKKKKYKKKKSKKHRKQECKDKSTE